MTTDIDALVAEAQSRIRHGAAIRPGEALDVCNRLIDALTAERAKVAALENKLAHIRLIEGDTSLFHFEKLGAIFRIARAGTSDHYSASDMHDNPERENEIAPSPLQTGVDHG